MDEDKSGIETEAEREKNKEVIPMTKRRNRTRRKGMESETWNLATINVRGISGKEIELKEIIEESSLDVLALTETKKKMKGCTELEGGHLLIHSGVDSSQWASAGVGCIVGRQSRNKIRDWRGISERLMRLEIEKGKQVYTIMIVYGPNEGAQGKETEEFWEALQTETENSTGTVIIIGDVNGRVGNNAEGSNGSIGKFGEETKNRNGQRIIDFCEINNMMVSNTFYQHKDIHKYTREVVSRNERSIIDLCIVERETLKKIKDVRVMRGYDVGSDHFLVRVTVMERLKQKSIEMDEKTIEYASIRINNLGRKDVQKKYQERTDEEIGKLEEKLPEMNLEELWRTFKSILSGIAAEVCGMSKTTNKKKLTSWWNDEIKQEIKEKKRLWKKYLSNGKIRKDYAMYKEQRDKVKNAVKEAKTKSWEEFGEKMEKNAEGNAKMLYHVLRAIRKEKKNPIKNLKNASGNITTEEREILELWREYFEQLLTVGHEEVDREGEQTEENVVKNVLAPMEMQEEPEAGIGRREVVGAIGKMKVGKAPGIDEIRTEMIKCLGDKGIDCLHRILQTAWDTETIPEEWKIAIITPIHKKGSSNECKNYRGISLLSNTYKIYERIIEDRLRQILDNSLSDAQAAFRTNRSTQDWIFTLRQIAEKITETNSEIYVATVDLEKAFDSIKREKIWELLRKRRVSKQLTDRIKSLYENTENVVRIGGKTTSSFTTNRGVRQGGVLSPLLFIIAMDEIAKEVNKQERKTHIGYNRLRPIFMSELMYADDLLIFANSKKELQDKIEKWTTEMKKFGLQINVQKTEIMKISNTPEEIDLHIHEQEKKSTNKLKYLGTIMRPDGRIEEEVSNRIRKTISTYGALYKVFFNKKEITKRTKIRVYESVLIPMLTYGCESWVLTDKLKQKVTTCEMKILRKIAGVTRLDKIRNEKIRSELKVMSAVQKIEQQQLRWFGHIVRMEEDRTVKIIWETEVNKKRRRGRPRKRWNAQIAESLRKRGLSWSQAKLEAKDRKKWRRTLTSTPAVEEVADK